MAWKTGGNFFHGMENPENRRDFHEPAGNMRQCRDPYSG
jgi:hypothetical protein